jgi:hypothetical protein
MGQAYLAEAPGGQPAVLKVIGEGLAADPALRAQFAQGVTAAQRVTGEFTTAVMSADLGGPRPWVATAYVAGPTLGELIARQGPLPDRLLLALGAALAEGVEAIETIRAVVATAAAGDDPFVLNDSTITISFAVTAEGSISIGVNGSLSDELTHTLTLGLVPAS